MARLLNKKLGEQLQSHATKWREIEMEVQAKYEGDSKYGQLATGQEKWDKDWKTEFDAIAKSEGWDKERSETSNV